MEKARKSLIAIKFRRFHLAETNLVGYLEPQKGVLCNCRLRYVFRGITKSYDLITRNSQYFRSDFNLLTLSRASLN